MSVILMGKDTWNPSILSHLRNIEPNGRNRCRRSVRHMLADLQRAPPSSIVRQLDDISVALCAVVDSAEAQALNP